MTKRHYKLLAEAIKISTDIKETHLIHKEQLLMCLIPLLKEDNKNFEGIKFIKACTREKVLLN